MTLGPVSIKDVASLSGKRRVDLGEAVGDVWRYPVHINFTLLFSNYLFLKSLNYAIPDISLLMEVYILQTPAVLLLHLLML